MMMKKILYSLLLVIGIEILLLPMYFYVLFFLGFNDSSYQATSFGEFLPTLTPVFFFVILFIIIYFLLRKLKCHKIIKNVIYLPLCLLITGVFVCLYMEVFLSKDINQKVNPLTIYSQKIEVEKLQENWTKQEKVTQEFLQNPSQYQTLYRSGQLGEDVGWEFFRDGQPILSRVAANELELDLSSLPKLFQEKGIIVSI